MHGKKRGASVKRSIDINNNSLSQIIAEKITEQIMSGELKPGEKVAETVYADEYGTSRAPVREALYLLTMEGLIVRKPRKGATVKGYSISEAYDLLEIRMLFEELAMKRIVMIGINRELVEKMEKLVGQMEETEPDTERYTELNREYHLCIIEMSQSETIKNMYSRLGLPLLSLQRISFLEEENMVKSVREHRNINKLLKENNVEGAKYVLHEHNSQVIGRIKDKLFTID